MLEIIYRLTDRASTNPSPIYQEDKFKLNLTCLMSFKDAFNWCDVSTHFLLDYCPDIYDEMIEEAIPWKHKIEHTELGINGTMLRAYEIASKHKGYVLFQECDYLYRPNGGVELVAGLERLGLVSPYNHPNFYKDRNIHSATCDLELIGDTIWRTTERNTMTWGCHSDLIREKYDTFIKYGYLDDQVWYDLRGAGHTLWVPMPSIATHMAKDWLAPGIHWRGIWEKLTR